MWDLGVDAVNFACDGDGLVFLRMGRCVEDLVHVFDAEEAVDGDLGDVLQLIINIITMQVW